jgi:PHP family Zn ribbon phosphoesterase
MQQANYYSIYSVSGLQKPVQPMTSERLQYWQPLTWLRRLGHCRTTLQSNYRLDFGDWDTAARHCSRSYGNSPTKYAREELSNIACPNCSGSEIFSRSVFVTLRTLLSFRMITSSTPTYSHSIPIKSVPSLGDTLRGVRIHAQRRPKMRI